MTRLTRRQLAAIRMKRNGTYSYTRFKKPKFKFDDSITSRHFMSRNQRGISLENAMKGHELAIQRYGRDHPREIELRNNAANELTRFEQDHTLNPFQKEIANRTRQAILDADKDKIEYMRTTKTCGLKLKPDYDYTKC